MTVYYALRLHGRACAVLLLVALLAPPASAQQMPPERFGPTPAGVAVPATDSARGGASRYVLVVDSTTLAAVDDVSQLLNGRVPGVYVMRRSGHAGAGSAIRIRGRNSVSLPTDPLVFVDGIRVDERSAVSVLVDASASASALDQLPVDEVERIEVLPGPAAAWRYGLNGANGIILVTTKRGSREAVRWRAFTDQGVASDPVTYPDNWGSWYTIAAGGPRYGCLLAQQAAGTCSVDSVTTFNPLEAVSPFRTGVRSEYGLEASGGFRSGAFRVAARQAEDGGIYRADDAGRTTLSASARAEPGTTLSLDGRVMWLRDERRAAVEPGDMGSFAGGTGGVLGAGLIGAPADDPVTRGYRGGSPEEYAARPTRWGGDRLTTGVGARWSARRWLETAATVGIDRNDSHERYSRYDLFDGFGTRFIHQTGDTRRTDYTFAAHGTARWARGPSLRGASTLGVDFLRTRARVALRDVVGYDGGEPVGTASAWMDRKLHALGLYYEQSLVWRERLTLNVGARADGHTSAFSFENLTDRVRPGASIAWDAVRDRSSAGWLGALRLRAAYGEAATPLPLGLWTQQVLRNTAWAPAPEYDIWPDGTRIVPEETREMEAGVDATLAGGRVHAGLAWYDRRTRNAFVRWAYFGPFGNEYHHVNGARLENHGIEGYADAALPIAKALTLRLAAQGALNSNEVVSAFGRAGPLPTGVSADSRWLVPYEGFDDANDDGVVTFDELRFGEWGSYGSSFPKREAALSAALSLRDRVTLGAMLDHRGGFEQMRRTLQMRCRTFVCRELNDPSTPLAEQARAVAATDNPPNGALLDRADFVRLRELSLSVTLPERWVVGLGARSARLSLAGRDLATWSSYDGLDPEVRVEDATDPWGRRPASDWAAQPVPRRFVARLELGW